MPAAGFFVFACEACVGRGSSRRQPRGIGGNEAPRLRGRPVGGRRGPEPVRAFLLLFALSMGVGLYGAFLPTERGRWAYAMHDRGVHALAAIKLAVSLKSGDFGTFFGELLKPKLYPPLQAWLGALAALVAGPHYRVVLLPSLLGWMGMIALGAGLAGKLAKDFGKVAAAIGGAVTLLFLTGSPAHRFYATDTMLESLGAGLTVAVLYAYARVRRQPDPPALRWLALALTALFFEKYNYWLLVVIALSADLALDTAIRRTVIAWLRNHGRTLTFHLLTQPLLWIAAALLLTAFLIGKRGETSLWGVSLYPPRGILMVMMWTLAAQAALELARLGRPRWHALPAWLRILWGWHLLPLLLWLMLPGRLGTIISFVGTGNAGDARYPGLSGIRYYAQCLATQYSANAWTLLLAVALAALGAVTAIRTGKGGRGVLMVLLVGAALATAHPNKQGRYLHSWIPALWILSGLGAAALIGALDRRARWTGIAAGVLLGGLLAFPTGRDILRHPVGADELAQYPRKGSLLDVTDVYLPAVERFRRVAIIAPSGWPVVEWTFLEKMGDVRRLDLVRWPSGITAAQAADFTRDWTRGPGRRCDAVVVITAPPGTLWNEEGYQDPTVTTAAEAALKEPASGFVISDVWRFSTSNAQAVLFTRSATITVPPLPRATTPASAPTTTP